MSWEVVSIISAVVLGWLGFLEKRLSMLKHDYEQQIKSEKELNALTIKFLSEELARIQAKLDAQSHLLLQIQVNSVKKDDD